MEKIGVIWFRQDLRLDDNYALNEICKAIPEVEIVLEPVGVWEKLTSEDGKSFHIKTLNATFTFFQQRRVLYPDPLLLPL